MPETPTSGKFDQGILKYFARNERLDAYRETGERQSDLFHGVNRAASTACIILSCPSDFHSNLAECATDTSLLFCRQPS